MERAEAASDGKKWFKIVFHHIATICCMRGNAGKLGKYQNSEALYKSKRQQPLRIKSEALVKDQ